tara:strand:+ start:1581 stop:1811 length:231 start_codon:yes stop_codon:yes gene_type:complete
MKAFVLISINEGTENSFLKELQSYEQITKAHTIFGEWDIIAELEMPTLEAMSMFLTDRVRSRDNVKLTSTLIVAGQ